jgi:predicted transcriptional regulator
VKARLENLAQSTDRTKSWLAAEAIRSFVEVQEWQVAEITRGVAEADADDFATSTEVEAVFEKWAETKVVVDSAD